MALNTSKCNHLTPLTFKGLNRHVVHVMYSVYCFFLCNRSLLLCLWW